MTERESSKTALGTTLLRAVHQLIDATPKILDDPIALELIDPAILDEIRTNPTRFQTPLGNALRSHVVIRSRYAEDRLARAVQRGIVQYLSLGAGYDTFPYRQPAWAGTLRIFEVDQSPTQQEKRAKLHAAGIPIPPNVEFVPVDFEVTSLSDGLRASSFDFSQPTFISWLGVMVYLSQAAAAAVFRFAVLLPHSSEIVFTFSTPRTREQQTNQFYPSLADRVIQLGEPFKNYIAPDDLIQRLFALGFVDVTIPTPAELHASYIDNRQDGLCVVQRQTIASAMV
ncbi:MAG: class I SAM-dependent methyltransferase [Anaerolineales bacterium]